MDSSITTAPEDASASSQLEPLTGGSTAYFGRVFPVVWTTAMGALTGAAWLDLLGDGATPTTVKWAMLTVWVALSTVIIRYFGSLRHVWRNGDELIVGDPRRGLRIHLGDVREIKESHFQQIKTVTLKLRRPTALGDSISFVPKGAGAFFFPLMSSGVAERLRERHQELAVQQHRMIGRSQ
ncbi:MAG TPA: hypothetical protein VLA36_13115 [Longimicrobiales bacterium]|nr:hypothetical protein [Longimicrobiales bacterium]